MNRTNTSINPAAGSSGQSRSWLRWLPFLILLIAAAVLLLEWERIPERWPVHWGVSGQADNWTNKTPFGVFFPLGLGVVICLFLEMMAVYIKSHPRSGKSPQVSEEAARAIAAMTADFVRLIATAIAAVFTATAVVLPLTRPEHPGWFVLFVFASVAIAVAIGMRRFIRGGRELKARGMFEGLEGWNGLIYRNPNDPRLWLPKITGIGYTLNFGHRRAWPVMILILLIPLLAMAIAVSVLLSR